MTLPFLYQLQNADYQSLSSGDFNVAVVDMDDSNLTAGQIDTMQQDQGKILITYLSIGEAEDYRAYWQDGDWSTNPPSFLLDENPYWEGNYLVEFWNAAWQATMFGRVDEAISLGYDGIYLDIVDAYTVSQVSDAYSGTDTALRQEMIDFVIALSEHAKAQDPDFFVIPQNAVGLLSVNENNPESGPNTAYLDAIDGLGVEDLWYDGNSTSGWTSGDLAYIQNALNVNKFVLATSYPTEGAKQETFVTNALDAGLIPFVADRDLTGTIDPINDSILDDMTGRNIATPWDVPTTDIPSEPEAPVDEPTDPAPTEPEPTVDETPSPEPEPTVDDPPQTPAEPVETPQESDTPADDATYGDAGNDVLTGTGSADILDGLGGNDTIKARGGDDILIGGDGNDKLRGNGGDDTIYGDSGRDKLFGGNGADHLHGGADGDILFGRGGADFFHFSAGNDFDVIKDFEDDSDTIVFHGFGTDDPLAYATQRGADVVFAFDCSDVLIVENTNITLLQDDLIIA